MAVDEVMNDLQYPVQEEVEVIDEGNELIDDTKIPAYIFEYDCQICGKHDTAIIQSSRFDPVAICPECAKRIKKLIYEEDDLK